MKNKGYVLTMDAIIALIFVMGAFIAMLSLDFFNPDETSRTAFLNLHYVSEDTLDVLNKVGVLDNIGELWSLNDELSLENASNITKTNLDLIIPQNVGYTLTIDGDCIYSSDNETEGCKYHSDNSTRPKMSEASVVTTSRRLLVGYGKDKPIRGCVARTYLTEIKSKTTSVFIYFGGFEGEGDLTKYVEFPGGNVEAMYIEVNAGNDFNLEVNGQVIEWYDVDPGADVMAANVKDTITNPDDLSYFDMGGSNEIGITFTEAENKYIGGGYIRVDYNTSDMVTFPGIGQSVTKRYYLPGIYGFINLYSSFDIPGELQSIDTHLHYENHVEAPTYFKFGNYTVYESEGQNETDIDLPTISADDLEIALGMSLDGATIPIRLGTPPYAVSNVTVGTADAVLVTDISGSMGCSIGGPGPSGHGCTSTGSAYDRDCDDPQINASSTTKLSIAKCADVDFVDTILKYTGNMVGLVDYSTSTSGTHDLSNDAEALKGEIDDYEDGGNTCICCGIKSAFEILTGAAAEPVTYINSNSSGWLYYCPADEVPANDANGSSWTGIQYNESESDWRPGKAILGTGAGSPSYSSNMRCDVSCLNLWPMAVDNFCPVDFTTNYNRTGNTFGLSFEIQREHLLENSNFTGPSISGWTSFGVVNLSYKVNSSSNTTSDDLTDIIQKTVSISTYTEDELFFEDFESGFRDRDSGTCSISDPTDECGDGYGDFTSCNDDNNNYVFCTDDDGAGGSASLRMMDWDWDDSWYNKGLRVDVDTDDYDEINVDFYMVAADLEGSGESREFCAFVVSDDDSTEDVKRIRNEESCEYDNGPGYSDTVWDSGNCHFSINVSDIPDIDMSDNELTFGIGGYIPGSEDYCKFDNIKITGIKTGIGNVTEQATENTTYNDVTSTVYGDITSITVKVEVDSYNPEGSHEKSSDHPDLELFMYDGSSWISMGTFQLTSKYPFSDLDNTNHNFTITTTNPSIIKAWNVTSNRDLRIRGVKLDGVSSPTHIDEINYTNLWVIVETTSVVDPLNVGLTDYWYVDSNENCPPDPGSPAGLRQTFTSPTDSPTAANLTFRHSGSSAYFGSSGAVGFCNLTHPGGETQVWFENWTSDPHGGTPVTETIDIKSYITSDTFTYAIECGAVVTESGGRTIIAFDEIDIEIEYTGASAGDDGWDYGYGNDAYGRTTAMSATSASYENQKLKVVVGGTTSTKTDSAAWGVQIYVSQSEYDEIAGGATATVSFDWLAQDRNYDTEEPCWVKSRFYKLGDSDLSNNYLGSSIDGGAYSDSTDEIMFIEAGSGGWDTESGAFTENIASYIDGPGWYYLDFGAKFVGASQSDEGIIAWFDNVMIELAKSDHYLRKHFSVSSPDEITSATMRIFSDDKADVYLNGNLVYSDPGPAHSAHYWNNETLVPKEYFVEYGNVVAVKLYGADSFTRFDMELDVMTEETREGHILVMSDGVANEQGGCGCSGLTDKECAIWWGQKACAAGLSVYSVGFGNVGVDVSTLQSIACNTSMYYSASDAESLQSIYSDIARKIINLSYTTQKINISKGVVPIDNTLYDDSYIDVTYIPEVHSLPYGAITMSFYSDTFGECDDDPICTGMSLYSSPFPDKGGWFKIPDNAVILSARVTSYSSDYWADEMYACSTGCENESNWHKFYDINDYGKDYSELGDAYSVNIPVEYLAAGEINYIRTGTAVGPNEDDKRGGSYDNRVIYELALTGLTQYSQPFGKCAGSNRTIFDSYGGNVTLTVGENASDLFDPENDSVDFSLWQLLDGLNFDNDPYDNYSLEDKTEIVLNKSYALHQDMISDGNTTNPIDIQITPNVYVGTVHGENIKSLWGPARFEVIVWM